jgi:hypothetical protein
MPCHRPTNPAHDVLKRGLLPPVASQPKDQGPEARLVSRLHHAAGAHETRRHERWANRRGRQVLITVCILGTVRMQAQGRPDLRVIVFLSLFEAG